IRPQNERTLASTDENPNAAHPCNPRDIPWGYTAKIVQEKNLMPRGRRTSSLAQLERRLADLDSQRQTLLGEIKSAVDRLTYGSAAPMARAQAQPGRPARRGRGRAAGRPKRRVSAEVRARLSRLAKERWAKVKKA